MTAGELVAAVAPGLPSGVGLVLAVGGLPLGLAASVVCPTRAGVVGVPPRLAVRMLREALSVRRRRATGLAVLAAGLLSLSGFLRALAALARLADLAAERAAVEVETGYADEYVMGMPRRLRRWRKRRRRADFTDDL